LKRKKSSIDALSIRSHYGTCEPIGRSRINKPVSRLHVSIIVDISRKDGSEYLIDHSLGARILGENKSRLNKPTVRFIAIASCKHLRSLCLCAFDIAMNIFEGCFIDHRTHEIAEIGDLSHGNCRDLGNKGFYEFRSTRFRDIEPRCRRALLTLIFISSSESGSYGRFKFSARIDEDKIFASRFSYNARIAPIVFQIR